MSKRHNISTVNLSSHAQFVEVRVENHPRHSVNKTPIPPLQQSLRGASVNDADSNEPLAILSRSYCGSQVIFRLGRKSGEGELEISLDKIFDYITPAQLQAYENEQYAAEEAREILQRAQRKKKGRPFGWRKPSMLQSPLVRAGIAPLQSETSSTTRSTPTLQSSEVESNGQIDVFTSMPGSMSLIRPFGDESSENNNGARRSDSPKSTLISTFAREAVSNYDDRLEEPPLAKQSSIFSAKFPNNTKMSTLSAAKTRGKSDKSKARRIQNARLTVPSRSKITATVSPLDSIRSTRSNASSDEGSEDNSEESSDDTSEDDLPPYGPPTRQIRHSSQLKDPPSSSSPAYQPIVTRQERQTPSAAPNRSIKRKRSSPEIARDPPKAIEHSRRTPPIFSQRRNSSSPTASNRSTKQGRASPEIVRHPPKATAFPIEEADDDLWIERIVAHRQSSQKTPHRLEYLIKWEGHPESHNSWQTEDALEGAEEALKAYRLKAGVEEATGNAEKVVIVVDSSSDDDILDYVEGESADDEDLEIGDG